MLFKITGLCSGLTLGISACILYYIGLIIHRLYFHPLARFPGPKLAAASKWYEFYFDFWKNPGGQFAYEVRRMHEVYGPIVRINPSEIHIRDSDYFEVLYASGSRREKYYNAAKMSGIPYASFGTVNHDIHKARRSANLAMFSTKAIHGPVQDILRQEAESLSAQFQLMYKNREIRNMRAMFLGYASVFAARYFWGARLDFQENREALHRWYNTVVALAKDTVLVKQFPWLTDLGMKMPRKVATFINPPIDGILTLQEFARKRASMFLQASKKDIERQQNEDKTARAKFDLPETIFDAIQDSRLPVEEKSYIRMWQEAFNVFIGAVDTTSRSLAYATYYLMGNPTFWNSLKEELDTTVPDPDVLPDLHTIERLPLLTATIKETIRCMQLISDRIPVVCPEDMVYEEWLIPAKTPISMSINDNMTSKTIYPDPDLFLPHRWLDSNPDGKTYHLHSRLDKYWTPFNQGPRQCQGREMAWAIIYLGLATVVRRFELRLADDFDKHRDADIVSEHFFGDVGPQSRGIRAKVESVRT